ncbi:hypothetical protein Glove_353g7 [Diversispora epigaea]|uniref:RGS domain-containing protein n=1 Tax=Diversispora epigaea TaxID=1348612 RepID=A0A397HJ12_9GLOM|nr:hypothetical protein Glove_353g7 [Diversispora epigaea]
MFKFNFKLLSDRKKENKNPSLEVKPELPAFEWQVTGDTGLADCITQATLTPPEDAIFGNTNGRPRSSQLRSIPKNNSRASESGRLRLMQIIEVEEARTNFRNYLVSQYCEENLDFYMDVAQYREFFYSNGVRINEDIREISSHAKYIWNFYLDADTSSKPLNVPQDLANSCRQKIDSRQYNIDIFDKLQQHCFDLMVQDSLPKFTRNSLICLPTSPTTYNLNTYNPKNSSYLRPPSFIGKPNLIRKSSSSGSLNLKLASTFTSTLASLKTSFTEQNSDSSTTINDTPNQFTLIQTISSYQSTQNTPSSQITSSSQTTSLYQTLCQTASLYQTLCQTTSSNQPTSLPSPPSSPNSSVSNSSQLTLTQENQTDTESNRSSTASTGSFGSTGSSLSAPTFNYNQRLSSTITNITRRLLLGRRNSTSSTSSQTSTLNSPTTETLMGMPGSYPCIPTSNIQENYRKYNNEYDEYANCPSEQITAWQKLRRNISTPNFQVRVTAARSRSSTIIHGIYIPDKNLPPIPAAFKA